MPPRVRKVTTPGVKAPGAAALGALSENNADENEKENILLGLPSGGDDLEQITRKLELVSLEKDNALKLLQEREAELQLKADHEQHLQNLLTEKEKEQKKLAQRVRQLENVKQFRPTLNVPANSSSSSDSQDSKKKNGAKKDRIKKPMSPFMMWCKEQRHQLKKEHPDASFTEMSKLLSEKWKKVPEEEKVPFIERYDIEKKVYQKLISKEKREAEAMKLFQDEENKKNALYLLEQYLEFKKEKETEGKKKKKEKDPEKPKKPTSAFFVFSNDRRPELLKEKMKITEIGKKLGEEWKALNEKEREPFEEIAREDKARYATELEAYKLKKASELKEAEDEDKERAKVVKAKALQLLKDKEEIDQVKKVVKANALQLLKDKEEIDQVKKVVKANALQLLKDKEKIDQVKKTLKDETLKKKKGKAPVDPERPKKPPTSYLLFTNERRKSVKQERPDGTFVEINAILAIEWQEMGDEEKQLWVKKAAIAREQYKTAMELYNRKKQDPNSAGPSHIDSEE